MFPSLPGMRARRARAPSQHSPGLQDRVVVASAKHTEIWKIDVFLGNGKSIYKWMITRGTPMTKRKPPCMAEGPLRNSRWIPRSTWFIEKLCESTQRKLSRIWTRQTQKASKGNFNVVQCLAKYHMFLVTFPCDCWINLAPGLAHRHS